MPGSTGAKSSRGFLAKAWPLLLLLAFLAVAVFYGESLKSRAQVGRAAPAFSLPGVDGETVSLEDFRGRPVIVNFWATWCPYCRYETPAHQAFLERFGDRVAYLAVNLREPPEKVRRHREEFASRGLPLEGRVDVLDRRGRVFSLYRSTGTPETWIIDGEGRAVRHFVGPTTFEDLALAVQDAGLTVWEEPAAGWAYGVAVGPGFGESGGPRVWVGAGAGLFTADLGAGGAVERVGLPLEHVRSVSAAPDREGVWALGRLVAAGEPDGPPHERELLFWNGAEGRRVLPGTDPLGVAAGPAGRVYVWTRSRGLVRSDDGGQTWRDVAVPFQPDFPGVAMAVDPTAPDHLLTAGPGGVWRTRDGGLTWERTDIEGTVTGIAFDPVRPGRVYLTDREGVRLSEDGGRTAERWLGGPQRSLVGVAAGPRGPVGVAANGDVYALSRDPAAEGPWRLWKALLDQPGPGTV